MINLYSGTPGSGKSLYCAYELIRWLNSNKRVIANFPIDFKYWRNKKKRKHIEGLFDYLDNSELTVDFLKSYAEVFHTLGKEHQTLLIIDECATMFNSRSWDRADRNSWITFFQQHRKLGFDVILISQNDRLIDRQIRAFIETEYKHRNLRNYKTFGLLLGVLSGGIFIRVEYWYGAHLKCGSQIFTLNKRKANIYNSYLLFK